MEIKIFLRDKFFEYKKFLLILIFENILCRRINNVFEKKTINVSITKSTNDKTINIGEISSGIRTSPKTVKKVREKSPVILSKKTIDIISATLSLGRIRL
tara:strand:+ start:151 stop:450 length:300 start_codon:yes stop_codon:yes gene_type:complete